MERQRLAVRNPRSGLNDYQVESCSSADLGAIVTRMRRHARRWSGEPLAVRIAALQALGAAIDRARPEIAAALEQDTGRRHLAGVEITAVTASIAAWVERAPGLCRDAWQDGRALPSLRYRTQWCPYGLVTVIAPWNFPFLLSLIDVIPALLAGCTVLLKPSEVTPRWIEPFESALATVPGLSDVLSIVIGGGELGAAAIGHADMVCFTGSIATGRKVASQAAACMIPISLELGGKDPLIVLASAELARAVTAALRSGFVATGQACHSIERIYVARGRAMPSLSSS